MRAARTGKVGGAEARDLEGCLWERQDVFFLSADHFSCEWIHTVEPGYGDAFKEDQEEQGHAAGRVVVKQFEHVQSTLGA